MKNQTSLAFCTLITSNTYLPGVTALAHSLKLTNTQVPIIVLYTPETVSNESIRVLEYVFKITIPVSLIKSKHTKNLNLLGRPELDVTYTKFHLWNPKIMQYDTIAYLDADTVVLKNIDDIFNYVDNEVTFAASPDIGWPDCFNSGVFVLKPNKVIFERLMDFSETEASFDGI